MTFLALIDVAIRGTLVSTKPSWSVIATRSDWRWKGKLGWETGKKAAQRIDDKLARESVDETAEEIVDRSAEGIPDETAATDVDVPPISTDRDELASCVFTPLPRPCLFPLPCCCIVPNWSSHADTGTLETTCVKL